MTRIAGLIGAPRAFEGVEDDLAAGRMTARPRFSTIETPEAIFGALSDRTALFEGEGLIIAVDGDVSIDASIIRRRGFVALLEQLYGEFALAVYDRTDRSLWLARDRLGVKPLYYTTRSFDAAEGGGAPRWRAAALGGFHSLFAFASRPRPLIRYTGIGARPNRRWTAVFAAGHYRYIDNVPDESPYERISQLPAAHWLHFGANGLRIGRYWQLDEQPDWNESEDELAERYRELLLSTVQRRFASAPRPAFTLSGGMDSSTVLGCAAFEHGRQPAFSTVYTDRTYDESSEIRAMLDHAASQWTPVLVDQPDVFATVARMIDANDEPVATATWLSHYELCRAAAAAGAGTLFGGLGGDELNAGEYEYFFFHFADLATSGRRQELDHEIERWAAHHDHPIFRKNAEVAAQTVAASTDRSQPGRCLPNLARMRRYYPALNRDFFDLERFEPVMEAPFRSYLKNRTYQDLTRETAPPCLRAEDRQTIAFGLENHVPFFDHRLVELMFRVPGHMKIRDGVTKVLLRKATRGIVADETRERIKKTGWNAPAHLWFSGRGREPLLDLLHSRRFRERGVYDVAEVLRLAEEHEEIVRGGEPRENHMMFFWQLVNLETWLDSIAS